MIDRIYADELLYAGIVDGETVVIGQPLEHGGASLQDVPLSSARALALKLLGLPARSEAWKIITDEVHPEVITELATRLATLERPREGADVADDAWRARYLGAAAELLIDAWYMLQLQRRGAPAGEEA
jgi:hypothetical protein